MSRPTTRLLLAMALAHENEVFPSYSDRKAIKEHWRSLSPEQRRHWLKKAERLGERLVALGPEGGRR